MMMGMHLTDGADGSEGMFGVDPLDAALPL
jgi:hypothetical protein